jgi:pimeloyl-ACP methyl ester carboxylesterase
MSLPHEWHGQGEPLVLIAGLGAKGTSWQPFLEQAARQFRVLTFDNRGSGRAPAIDAPLAIRDLALDLLQLLDQLGVERASVVGRSMGGMIAQELALIAPERVTRLGLVSTTGRADRHLASVFRVWAQMAEAGVSAGLRHQSSLLWCLGAKALERNERVRSYLRARASTDRPGDYAAQARACAAHDALGRLGQLCMPTLVLGGSDDRLTPPAHAEALGKAIGGARIAHIPGAGHLAYLESPERFAREVLGLLQGESRCPTPSSPS